MNSAHEINIYYNCNALFTGRIFTSSARGHLWVGSAAPTSPDYSV